MKDAPGSLRLLSCALLCFGAAAVLFFGYKTSGGVPFDRVTVWALLPYLLSFVAVALPQARFGAACVLLGCGVFALGGTFVYYDAVYVHPDPQNGVLFAFVPAFQLAGSLMLFLFSCLASFVSRLVGLARPAQRRASAGESDDLPSEAG